MPTKNVSLFSLFSGKFIRGEGCWPWIGAKNADGYGQMRNKGRFYSAHRLSYEFFVGPIGDLHVLHNCDNPSCVNPAHLFLGTHQDNIKDRDYKDRVCHGTDRPNHKLTETEVLAIRFKSGLGITVRELAKEYGVAPTTIVRICGRKKWKRC